jgi:UDP-3-O-[3-hydroxymyristoyl] N-acetylglucosamine deacetylase
VGTSVRRIVREFAVEGRGLHGGERAAVRVRPAAHGVGIRIGRAGSLVPLHPGLAEHEAVRCTALRLPGGTVRTVEHLLAAVLGCGVRDVELELEGPEVPILDGSARPWVEALSEASEPAEDEGTAPALAAPLRLRCGDAEYAAEPAATGSVEVELGLPRAWLGLQHARWDGEAASFAREIAPARTFALLEDVGGIFAAGLARGGSLDCAAVLGPDGPLGGPLRFPDEPVRHKLLDLVGDLALLGRLPAARITARGTFHGGNRTLACRLAEVLR